MSRVIKAIKVKMALCPRRRSSVVKHSLFPFSDHSDLVKLSCFISNSSKLILEIKWVKPNHGRAIKVSIGPVQGYDKFFPFL